MRPSQLKRALFRDEESRRTSIATLLLGRRLAWDEESQHKMGVLEGLPALGLDGLSSSAYGPEAALTILIPLGTLAPHYLVPVILVILALLTLLYLSYRQTIAAYPQGGGSFTVARENLGVNAGLLAAAALMIDYVLNVAVGISAGVGALISAVPSLHHHILPLCLAILVLITLANLRGTREAGLLFSLPTYVFVAGLGGVLVFGTVHSALAGGHLVAAVPPPPLPPATEGITLWLLLRSFASGCTAMTGVEAVSNGVAAFRDPPVRHAGRTLGAIIAILALLLAGIAYLCHVYEIGAMDQSRRGYQSVLSQIVTAVAGRGIIYHVTIASILAVLCLSANTSFVDFPRLCRIVAQEGFLPRAFAAVGRRLVFWVGILFLACTAGAMLIVFGGITDRLIPLFAVGAFLAFTLSQAGMVMHWRRQLQSDPASPQPSQGTPAHAVVQAEPSRDGREGAGSGGDRNRRAPGRPGARYARFAMFLNGTGAVGTAIALAVIIVAKFIEGAWITIVAIPVLWLSFKAVRRHYDRIARQLDGREPLDFAHNDPPVVLLPARGWNRLTRKSLLFAMRLSPDVIAVHLGSLDDELAEEEERSLRRQWAEEVETPAHQAHVRPPRLMYLQSPYRQFTEPLLKYLKALEREYPHRLFAVVIPELIEPKWWDAIFHTGRTWRLKSTLLSQGGPRVVVITVPWYLREGRR